MLGPVDWFIWVLSLLFEASVIVCSLRRKSFRRYFLLNLYMLISVLISAGTFRLLLHYGRKSLEYRYFYFYSEALLIIVLYFALIGYLRRGKPILASHADVLRF